MFCEDIPRFANLFGITTNVEISDRVPLDFLNLLLFNHFICLAWTALGALRSIGKGILYIAIALGLHSDLNVGTQRRIHN